MNSDALNSVLESLLRLPREQATVEFKSNWEQADDIGQYISALANVAALHGHDRAWVIWGVNDTTRAVTGTTFDPFTQKSKEGSNQALTMWLQVLTAPRADFSFHEVQYQQHRVVMLEIHPARSAPVAFQHVRYIRVDSHKVKLADHPDKEATRSDLDELLLAKLPDVLVGQQRANKVKNLVQGMRRAQLIELRGKRPKLFWHLADVTDKTQK